MNYRSTLKSMVKGFFLLMLSAVIPFALNGQINGTIQTDQDTVSFEAYANHSATEHLVVSNTGNDSLEVTSITTSDPDITLSETSFFLASGNKKAIGVQLVTSTPGTRHETLTIESSDTLQSVYQVTLAIHVEEPPHIEVSTDTINSSVTQCGDSVIIPLTIYNTGNSELATKVLMRNNEARYSYLDSDHSNGPEYEWFDISLLGTETNLSGDDNYTTINLPFDFPYYGDTKTAIKASTNGYLTFGNSGSDYRNAPIPSSGAPNDIVAPFWDDLNGLGEHYYYYDTDNHRFIIQYSSWPPLNGTGNYNFQVHLHENGDIFFYYENLTAGTTGSTIGLENSSGTEGLQIAYNSNYLHNNMAIQMKQEPSWIHLSEASATIPAGDSATIHVTLSSQNKYVGILQSRLYLMSNDPDSSMIQIPVYFNYSGTPTLNLSDTVLAYGDVFEKDTICDTILITNSGCDTLKISNIASSGSELYTSVNTMIVMPANTGELPVTFTPNSLGSKSGTLTLYNNDADTTINYTANCIAAPVISSSTDTLSGSVTSCSDSVMLSIMLYNTGGNNLVYQPSVFHETSYNESSSITLQTTGENTVHEFAGLNTSADTMFLTVTLNGDYDQQLEYATLQINGHVIEQIDDGNAQNGTNIVKHYVFTKTEYSDMITNGEITVQINNSVDVNPNMGGTDVNKVEVKQSGFPWIDIHSNGDTIAPGDSSAVTLYFKAENKFEGFYTGEFKLESNDPVTPDLPVNCEFNLIGTPSLALVDTSIYFHDIYTNDSIKDTLQISNTGCDTLKISHISSTSPVFIPDTTVMTILPGNFGNVGITFTSDSAGIFNDTLSITSNAGDTTISLQAAAQEPPVMSFSIDSVQDEITVCGDTTSQSFKIYNTGGSPLIYSITKSSSGSFDTTSTKYYSSTGETVNHSFSGWREHPDSITVEVKLNGDYNSWNEYAELLVDGTNLGMINDGNVANTVDIIESRTFAGTQMENFLMDGNLEVSIRNSSEVHIGYGAQLNQARLIFHGTGWMDMDTSQDTVASGDSSTVHVLFNGKGSLSGLLTGHIPVNSNESANPRDTIPVLFTINGQPTISLPDTVLSMGTAFTNVTLTDTLTIGNIGCDTLQIINISSSQAEFSADTTSLTLCPWETKQLGVFFNSPNSGNFSSQLTIVNNDKDTTINLYATAIIPPKISLSKDSLSGVINACGDSTSTSMIVYNTGSADLTIQLEDTSGTLPQWINISALKDTIASGDSTQFDFQFTTSGLVEGINLTNLVINSNDPDSAQTVIPCFVEYIPQPGIRLSDTTLSFGDVFVNGKGSDTLTLYNPGCDTLNVTGFSSASMNFDVDTSALIVLPGDSALVKVIFAPDSIGNFTGEITLANDATDTTLFVNGTGIAAPVIEFSSNSIDATLNGCNDNDSTTLIMYNKGGNDLDYNLTSKSSSAFDSTSVAYYTTVGETTLHSFTGIPRTTDSITVIVTLNGDYDWYSEYASLIMDGTFIQQIEDNDVSNTTDIVQSYTFKGSELESWLADGQIMVSIKNCSYVNPGYGAGLNQVQIIANGISWLQLNHGSGTIAAGDSTSLDIQFNSNNLVSGTFNAEIITVSNDPVNSQITIPVSLTFAGTPAIETRVDSLQYGLQYTGTSTVQSFWVFNTGCDSLKITDISSSHAAFNIDTTQFLVLPGDSSLVNVLYEPTVTGSIDEEIVITSNAGNDSIMVTGEAIEPPVMAIAADSLLGQVTTCNDSVPVSFTIENNGNTNLVFEIFKNFSHTSDMGKTLKKYSNFITNSVGLVWIDGYLYSLNYTNNSLEKFDAESQELLGSYPIHQSPYGIAYNGTNLLIGDVYGNAYYYDLQGNAVGNSIKLPENSYFGITWDGEYFVVAETYRSNSPFYKINGSGDIIETYTNAIPGTINEIVFVPNHKQGKFWIIDPSNNRVRHVALNNNSATEINNFMFADNNTAHALAHNGSDLLFLDHDGPLYQLHDGIWEGWKEASISSGNIAANSSATVDVQFNSAGLAKGTYKGGLLVKSNDPDNPEKMIHTRFKVEGSPDLEISTSSIDFGDVMLASTGSRSLFMHNSGCDTLHISGTSLTNSNFSVDRNTFAILPGETEELMVTFNPPSLGTYSGVLAIYNNDTDVTVDLTGASKTGYTLSYHVHEDGTPIEGASILIGNRSMVTDATGNASLDTIDGTYHYQVTLSGYNPVYDSVTVNGTNATDTVSLDPVYPVSFTVTDGTNPLENAIILVGNSELTTDHNGQATVDTLDGNYTYTVNKPGYDEVTGNITVSGSAVSVSETLQLTRYPITFVVTNQNNPVAGIDIEIENQVITTNAAGEASFDTTNGSYSYAIRDNAYGQITGIINVAGSAFTETVSLELLHTITFYVTDGSNPVQGATIDMEGLILTTDANGRVMTDTTNGSYSYDVTKSNHLATAGTIEVSGSDTTEDVILPKLHTIIFGIDDGSTALENVTVTIGNNETKTNSNGYAYIDTIDGTYNYTLSKAGYNTQMGTITISGGDVMKYESLDKLHHVTLVLRDKSLPLEDAKVTLAGRELITNIDGEVNLDTINGTYNYLVESAGYDPAEGTVTVADANVNDTVTLNKLHTITFQVSDGTNPLENAIITFGNRKLTTNYSGEAILDTINGSYNFTVTLTNYDTVNDIVDVIDNNTTKTVTMDESKYPVTFMVTDGTNPMENATITIGSHQLKTNESGEAAMDTINGSYDYTVTYPGYKQTSGSITVAGTPVSESITMAESTYSITFNVTGVTQSLEGAVISIGNHTLTTNSSGVAVLDTLNGTYSYMVYKNGYNRVYGNVTLADANTMVNVKMNKETEYQVTFIIDDGTSLVDGASVEVANQIMTTDAWGETSINLTNGSYNYTVNKKGFDELSGSLNVTDAPVTENVSLTATTYEVEFLVNDGNQPLQGATVNLSGYGAQTTDGNGTTVFTEVLPENDIYYSVAHDGYNTATGSFILKGNISREVTLTSYETNVSTMTEMNIRLYPNPTQGKIKVAGNQISGAKATVRNAIGVQLLTYKLNANENTLDLNQLQPGIYFIEIQKEEDRLVTKIIVE